jgi:hypothetical protein
MPKEQEQRNKKEMERLQQQDHNYNWRDLIEVISTSCSPIVASLDVNVKGGSQIRARLKSGERL